MQEQGIGDQLCGTSISHEDRICIASINKQPNNYLHSAPICFPTGRIRYCDRICFVQEQGLGDRLREESVYISQVSTISSWHFCTSMFTNGHNCGLFQIKIHARPGCGRLLTQLFGQYWKYQQLALDTSALYTYLFPNRQKCGLW